MSSSRDFGVELFFRADDFRADDPSPYYFNFFTKTKKSDSRNLTIQCRTFKFKCFKFLHKIKQVAKVPLFLSNQKHGLQILNFFSIVKILEAFTDDINDAKGVW